MKKIQITEGLRVEELEVIKPPSTELRFKQITAVPAGGNYKNDHWLYGLTEDGEVFYKSDDGKAWNKEPMDHDPFDQKQANS